MRWLVIGIGLCATAVMFSCKRAPEIPGALQGVWGKPPVETARESLGALSYLIYKSPGDSYRRPSTVKAPKNGLLAFVSDLKN